jgi:hypothetical protein
MSVEADARPQPTDDSGNRAWTQDVADMIAAAGLPWRVTAAWCSSATELLCVEVAHQSSGKSRLVTLRPSDFPTPLARREEVLRQLREAR